MGLCCPECSRAPVPRKLLAVVVVVKVVAVVNARCCLPPCPCAQVAANQASLAPRRH